MTLTLPTDGASTSYWTSNAGNCIQFPSSTTHTLALKYQPKCEGRTVHMFGYAQPGAAIDYFDAGTITFVNGSNQSVGGSYAPTTVQTLQIDHLPGTTVTASAEILARSGDDLLSLSNMSADVAPQAGSATFALPAVPHGSSVHISAQGIQKNSLLARSELLAPATIEAATTIDASAMLPLFDSLTVGADGSFAWTGGDGRGTVISFIRNSLSLSWQAFLEPTATGASFPAFPADLGVPVPDRPFLMLVTKLDVPGAALNDVVRALDRGQDDWPDDVPELAPATGSSISRIQYDIFSFSP
jgi:hypothetical protein